MTQQQSLAYSPAAERNSRPITEAIRPVLSALSPCSLLEIASGTGQHAAAIASAFPHIQIQPSDLTLERSLDVAGWAAQAGVEAQVAPLKRLDAQHLASSWTGPPPDVIYCANMIHISPWEATIGLFEGASALLPEGGYLILYGPYRFESTPLEPSNIAFDESLRSRDSRWGIRSVSALDTLALQGRLARISAIACPANNHVLVYQA